MGSHTSYDDVFRTLTVDCSGLLLPVLNEVFGEHYTGDEKIVFSQNEHFFRQQDGRTSEQLTEKGELNEYTKCTITEMTDKVVMHIARRYEQVRKGVKQVMGGQVLEYEAKTILNRGRAEGLRQGLKEGEVLNLILLVCRKLAKGKEAPQIAEELEEDLDRIEEICVAAGQCGPEYDREKIYALMQSKDF